MKTMEMTRAGRPARHQELRFMLLASMTCALIALCAQIAIPLPLVPVNLALLPVFLAGFILPKRWALISVGMYLLMGALGLPVFSGFRGGPQALFGPTGGYLLGYLFSVGTVAFLRGKGKGFTRRFLICLLALLACYIPGTLWLLCLTGRPLAEVLSFAVLPFIPGDALKSLAASLLVPALQKALAASRVHS